MPTQDAVGIQFHSAFCVAQAKHATLPGRRVANELGTGTLDVTKDDVVCLPALPTP